MADLKVGQTVRFKRTHDKAVELTGKVVKLHEDGRSVDVQLIPDGVNVQHDGLETAHVDDCTVIDSPAQDDKPARKFGKDRATD